ncbi:hypothetical protein EVAR_24003_1 [Eumeta japonica]|uniref:Uncharacterized protein n=1 Tax=Eumeta variegata TaxID=151549 RepID=A0A4C1W9N6_EUMVA|nr:hypothetical protein EVAR_24003_1 [Eumeta japonica]
MSNKAGERVRRRSVCVRETGSGAAGAAPGRRKPVEGLRRHKSSYERRHKRKLRAFPFQLACPAVPRFYYRSFYLR